jgi:hypothetical protein
MIFHTIYSITIGEFEVILESDNINLTKRIPIWLPKKIVEKGFNNLLAAHNKNSSKNKIADIVEEDFAKMDVNDELYQYDIILKLIDLYNKSWGDPKKKALSAIKRIYKANFGKEPTIKYIENIGKSRTLLIEKAEQTFTKPKKNDNYSFSEELIDIQERNPTVNLRNEKLFLLPKYIENIAKNNQ